MGLHIINLDRAIEVESFYPKIEDIYVKISDIKKKLYHKNRKLYRSTHTHRYNKIAHNMIRKKIKTYKDEILTARKLKQDGILLPLSRGDEGIIYTDEIHDTKSLVILANMYNWSKKCLWYDLVDGKKYIIYLGKRYKNLEFIDI